MPTFVIETFVSSGDRERFAGSIDDLRGAIGRTGEPRRARHIRSFVAPDDEMGFHVLEAGAAADVAAITAGAGIDVERVVEVVRVDVPDREGIG